MTLNEYEEFTTTVAAPLGGYQDKLFRGVLGLCGESGELADYVKKAYYQGHPYIEGDVLLELGDILFYVATLARDLGYSLELIAKMNMEKLQNRYPNGFDPERSQKRE